MNSSDVLKIVVTFYEYSKDIETFPWDNIGAWTTNTEYQAPDVKTVIQEIVGRTGWSSGNTVDSLGIGA